MMRFPANGKALTQRRRWHGADSSVLPSGQGDSGKLRCA
eukprot:CAMPEP_0203887178 /NCGR_PEP_ID=MMETSP0359-20131031/30914_1 /ASSEMBLY_ACC=CAM_ASM_000338 /TAXON_ID=268821 /ORGANISM="Scrippsiella Hangoei, Strain SHTV-5" /LENGTH=38 /DNA_ID= /DNA_START= /DNA_END= /DNA_ORIENTATION=